MALSERAKKARALYQREYREKNKDKIEERLCKFWEAKADEYEKAGKFNNEKDE